MGSFKCTIYIDISSNKITFTVFQKLQQFFIIFSKISKDFLSYFMQVFKIKKVLRFFLKKISTERERILKYISLFIKKKEK